MDLNNHHTIYVNQIIQSSSFAELVDLNHEVVRRYLVYAPVKLFRGACGSKFLTVSYTVVIHSVKLFRGACGSKFFTVIPNINNIWSSSFAELVDLNLIVAVTLWTL